MQQTRTLLIQNMSCGNCVRHVTRALSSVAALSVQTVQIGSAEVSFDSDRLAPAAVLDTLENAGYPATIQE